MVPDRGGMPGLCPAAALAGGVDARHDLVRRFRPALDDGDLEFTFRFNRRRSQARGLLFHRLAQQAVAVPPAPYHTIVGPRPDVLG